MKYRITPYAEFRWGVEYSQVHRDVGDGTEREVWYPLEYFGTFGRTPIYNSENHALRAIAEDKEKRKNAELTRIAEEEFRKANPPRIIE